MQFDHLAFEANDIAAAVEFYRELLPELRLLYRDDTWALIEASGVKIAFVKLGEHPAHMAFRVVSHEELEREAAKHNVSISIHRDKSESIYVNDPSGNAIEIIWYPKTD